MLTDKDKPITFAEIKNSINLKNYMINCNDIISKKQMVSLVCDEVNEKSLPKREKIANFEYDQIDLMQEGCFMVTPNFKLN